MARALRIWHIEHVAGYVRAVDQFGGFTRHPDLASAEAYINTQVATHGDSFES